MSAPLQKIHLVRHGETAWSLSGQHSGRADLALTARGREEARGLRASLARLVVSQVLASPLLRARQTAEEAGFGARVEVDDDLMEWDCGAYEGRRTAEIRSERPGWKMFADGCPGGESARDVGERADRVITRMRAVQGDVLVFAHRDLLRVLAARWLGLDAAQGRLLQLSTASLSVLGYDHGVDEPVILGWGLSPSEGAQ